MKSLILFLCLIVTVSTDETSNVYVEKQDIDQLLDHYHQIDMAPFVPTEKAKDKARNAIVMSMVALIQKGRLDQAKDLFDRVQETDFITNVVIKSYDGTLINTMRMIEFLKSLDRKVDQMRGFSELYDEMKRRKDMKNPVIIEIAYWMQHHLEDADVVLDTDEYPERFLYYDTEKYSIVTETLARLAEKMRNGDFEEVLLLTKTYPGAMTAVFPRLIRETYNNDLGNFNAVMGFVYRDDLSQQHRELVLNALLTFMHENNQVKTPKFETLKEYINSSTMNTLKKKVANVERNNQ